MLTAWLRDVVLQMGAAQFGAVALLLALSLLAAFAFCFRRLRFLRLIEDTPTARVRSAPQGYVELEGRVEFPRAPALTSPLRGVACVWWAYRIEELDPVGESEPMPWDVLTAAWSGMLQLFGSRPAGRVIEAGRSHECFLMRDDTGACVIDPDKARIVGAETRRWTKGTQYFEESVIPVGKQLYALGLFRTAHDHDAALERRGIGTLISTWKLDRIKLAQRFDANRNGVIDGAEWDAVWQAATAEVRAARGSLRPAIEYHVLCDPADRRPFLLSALSQQRLAGRLWFECLVSAMAGVMLAVLLAWSLGVRGLI